MRFEERVIKLLKAVRVSSDFSEFRKESTGGATFVAIYSIYTCVPLWVLVIFVGFNSDSFLVDIVDSNISSLNVFRTLGVAQKKKSITVTLN